MKQVEAELPLRRVPELPVPPPNLNFYNLPESQSSPAFWCLISTYCFAASYLSAGLFAFIVSHSFDPQSFITKARSLPQLFTTFHKILRGSRKTDTYSVPLIAQRCIPSLLPLWLSASPASRKPSPNPPTPPGAHCFCLTRLTYASFLSMNL